VLCRHHRIPKDSVDASPRKIPDGEGRRLEPLLQPGEDAIARMGKLVISLPCSSLPRSGYFTAAASALIFAGSTSRTGQPNVWAT